MEDLLKVEKAYLKANLAELQKKYPGKYLLIKGEKVHGAFETFKEGVEAGHRLPDMGRCFLVRSVLEPDDPEPLKIPALTLGLISVVNS